MNCLRPLAANEYSQWRAQTATHYAADKVRVGRWTPDEALAEAEKELISLLPGGLETPGHSFYAIESEEGQFVGVAWLGLAQRAHGQFGFIFDLVVWPEYRRQGYAKKAMCELERVALARGLKGLALHVFGHNHLAQRLYSTLGYLPTSITMQKSIQPASDACN